MPLFDHLGKKLSDFSQDIANQSKAMTDSAKWNQEISKEESRMDGFYLSLGKQYYQRMRAQGVTPEEDIFLFASLDNSMEKIKDLQKQIANAKGKLLCPKCGHEHSLDSKFCTQCGSPLQED